jgi:hypothetical protein
MNQINIPYAGELFVLIFIFMICLAFLNSKDE